MNLPTRFYVWTCGWTTSQLLFLFFLNLWWMSVAGYMAYRFSVAQESAIYWQEQAITNNVYHK